MVAIDIGQNYSGLFDRFLNLLCRRLPSWQGQVFVERAGLETGDTADLEVCATGSCRLSQRLAGNVFVPQGPGAFAFCRINSFTSGAGGCTIRGNDPATLRQRRNVA